MLEIVIKTVNDLAPDDSGFIARGRELLFAGDSMVYALPERYLLGYAQGEPVTQMGILQRTITVDDEPLLIAGLGYLLTLPEHRGQGYATELMAGAVTFVRDTLDLSYCLLTCKLRLESLYAGMGWRALDAPNVFTQPTGNRRCGGLIMVFECGPEPWPEGDIDLRGLPW